jgi:glycosyltransferase involved in cell wall biosynthesis
MRSVIAVVAECPSPWGGSEELWSQTATRLVKEGVSVAASIHGWSPLHPRVHNLTQSGVKLSVRPQRYPAWKRLRRRLLSPEKNDCSLEVERFLSAVHPKLVIFSTGGVLPTIEWLEFCHAKRVPFVTIAQANCDYWWFDDGIAARYRQVLSAAVRCFFVSEGNLRLTEKQIGGVLSNSEVVRNPFNVAFDFSPTWPSLDDNGELRLACVGRLDLRAKGQDILLEALAEPVWKNRKWRLTLYGSGPMGHIIERFIERLELAGRVHFGGFVSRVEDIWKENHVLAMPSRFEGLPLVLVEAMLCGRAAVVTNVAGHSEIVEDGINGFLADAPTVASFAKALERLWESRYQLRLMGEAAANSIRASVPADPVKVFSEKIQNLLSAAEAVQLRAFSVEAKHTR